jgi:tetratricopeptide (TPR) repeat protein
MSLPASALARAGKRTTSWALSPLPMPPFPPRCLAIRALLFAALCPWLPPSLLAAPQRPHLPAGAEKSNVLGKLTLALQDFSNQLFFATFQQDTLSRKERFALTHKLMDQRVDLPPGTCAEQVPALARAILEDPGAALTLRACAHFVLGRLEEAEKTALEAGAESSGARPQLRAVAWRLAADVACEEGDTALGLKRAREAAKHATPEDSFDVWSTIHLQIGRLLFFAGDKDAAVLVLRRHQTETYRFLGPQHSGALLQHNRMANALFTMGLAKEAEVEFRVLLKTVSQISGADSEKAGVIRENLAKAIRAQGREQDAETLIASAPKTASAGGMARMKRPAISEQDRENLKRWEHMGIHLYERLDYAGASEQFRQSYDLNKRLYGAEASGTLMAQSNLAVTLYELGKNDESVTLLREAVAISERMLPEDHLDTLERKNNLANALGRKGEHEEAATYHRHVAVMRKKILGPDHPKTIDAFNNLAGNLDDIGQPDEAERVAREVVASRMRVQGPEHQQTLASRQVLSGLMQQNGKKAEALEEDLSIVATFTRVYGRDDPGTLWARKDLANSLEAMGRYDEAERECTDTLDRCRSVLGQDHPLTVQTQKVLASIKVRRGDGNGASTGLADARDLLQRSLKNHGPDAEQSLGARISLANLLHRSENHTEANQEYEIALKACKALGDMTSHLALNARNGHALNLRGLRRFKEAEAAFRDLVRDVTRVLGTKDPVTLDCMENLALTLRDLNKHEEALEIRKKELPLRVAVNGEGHPQVTKAYMQMADLLHRMKRPKEGLEYLRTAYETSRRVNGESFLETQIVLYALNERSGKPNPPAIPLVPQPGVTQRPMTGRPGNVMNSASPTPYEIWQSIQAAKATSSLRRPPEHEELDRLRTPLFPEEPTSFEMLKNQVFGQ